MPFWCSFGILLVVAVAMYRYVSSTTEIEVRRAERAEIQASIDDLNNRGGKMKRIKCGPQSRLPVDPAAGSFYVDGNKDDTYMIVKGY